MALDPETFDALIDTVRRFVAERLRPLEARGRARTTRCPRRSSREMRDMGLFGLSIPEEYGGLGLSMGEEVRVALELGRTSPAFRSAFGTNVGIGSQGLVMAGTRRAEGRMAAAASPAARSSPASRSTEPGAGSDSASVQTARGARRRRLSADRHASASSPMPTRPALFTVMARTGGAGRAAASPPSSSRPIFPASRVGKPEKKMGQQGAHVCDVNFDEVPVPAANRLGEEGEGFKIAMRVLDRGRLHIAAVCVGVAERLIADCVAYASERKQFGKPIADFQLIQAMIADSQDRDAWPRGRWCWRRRR